MNADPSDTLIFSAVKLKCALLITDLLSFYFLGGVINNK